jgi:predicted ferric reductase
MPLIYLLLIFHAVVLAPAAYWTAPIGLLLALLFAAGGVASVLSLGGRIGRGRRVNGTIVSVQNPAPDVVEVGCRLEAGWRGHRAGQFAFVTFDPGEGHHPFTIASGEGSGEGSGEDGDHTITFAIKALGDYTRRLPQTLEVGRPVQVEGPYGRFLWRRANPRARQIWVAGGIGITPFLAWLESLQGEGSAPVAAELHYCLRDRHSDPFVARLQALCGALPGVQLHLHDNASGPLTPAILAASLDGARRAEVWFCGPQGLAQSLRNGLRQLWTGRVRFHQEAFAMR